MKDIEEIRNHVDTIRPSTKQKQKRRRRYGITKKQLGVVLLTLALVTTFAAAQMIFGTFHTTIHVSKGIEIIGPMNHDITVPCGDATYYELFKNKIKNNCEEKEICVTLDREFPKDIDVSVEYYIIDGWQHLELTSKTEQSVGEPFIPTTDMHADLWFNPCCPDFTYNLEAEGLDTGTSYSIIYYADRGEWGGTDDIVTIDTFNSDNLPIEEKTITSHNVPTFPFEDDDNIINPVPDSYTHTKGAKIWIVPTNKVDGLKNSDDWCPEQYLFETDLVIYTDCDEQPGAYIYNYFISEEEWTYGDCYPIPAGEERCLYTYYDIQTTQDTVAGDYPFNTELQDCDCTTCQ